MDFLSLFCILSFVVIVGYIGKELYKKIPIGCLIIFVIILCCFIKACSDMKEEEREREEWNRKFQEELEYKDRQWRKLNGNTTLLIQDVNRFQTT